MPKLTKKSPYKLDFKFVKNLPDNIVAELRDWVEEFEGEQKCKPINGTMVCNFTWHGIEPVRNKSGRPRAFPCNNMWKNEDDIVKGTKLKKEESKDPSSNGKENM